MRLGIVAGGNVESYSSIRQTAALPAGPTALGLSFWYYPIMEDDLGDLQYVLVMEEGGEFEVERLTSDARSWQYHEMDLSPYAGETINLFFSVYNDGNGGRAAMYVDDVSLRACWGELPPTLTPTTGPTTTSTPTFAPASTPSPGPTPSSTPAEPAFMLGQIPVGRHPHGVAVDAASGLVYTANHMDGTVSVVDAASGSVRHTIELGGEAGSNGIAIDTIRRRAYVANSHSDSVSVIDLDEQCVIATIPVQRLPNGVGVDTSSAKIYVACFGSGSVSVIDGLAETVEATVPVGTEPSMIGVAASRREVYVTNHHHLFNSVSVIDAAGGGVIDQLSVDRGPYGLALDEGQDMIYTANRDAHTVSVVSRDGTRLADVPLASSVYVVAHNPNTNHVFALCSDDNLVHVLDGDGTSFEVLTSLPVGNEAEEGIAVDVSTNRVYITNGGDDTLTVIQDVGPLPKLRSHLLPLVLKGCSEPGGAPTVSVVSPASTPSPDNRGAEQLCRMPVPGIGGVSSVATEPGSSAIYYGGEGGLVKQESHDGKQVGWYRRCSGLVDIEVSSGRVLATSWEDGALLVFDADDGDLLARVAGFVRPSGVAVGLGRVFVADTGADRLIILDETTCGIMESWPVDGAPGVVEVDETAGRVHVACHGGGTVTTFDVFNGRWERTVSFGGLGFIQGMTMDDSTGRVFVSYGLSAKQQSVGVVDGRGVEPPFSLSIEDAGLVCSVYALEIGEGEGLLYLSTTDALLTLDPLTGRVLGRVPSSGVRSPFGMGVEAGSARILLADLGGGPVLAVSEDAKR